MYLIKFSPLLLLLVILFSSCTVEKMRYSKGYNIEWIGKKNHNISAKKTKYIKEKIIVKNAEINEPDYSEKNIIVEKNQEIIKDKAPLILDNKINEIPNKSPGKNMLKKSENKVEISKKLPTDIAEKNSIRKTEKTQLVGIALFLIAFLFALLGYVFFTILGIFFGPIFLVIFLIAAAIYFVAGIISLIV